MEFLRKQIGLILRVLVSSTLIFLLTRKISWPQLIDYVRNAHVVWLFVGLLILGGTILIGNFRWKILLKVQGIDLPYSKLLSMNMIGTFFNAFLLGVTGGDGMKIYYVAQAAPDKRSAAGLSVIYDRIIGLLGIMVWGIGFILTSYASLTSTADTHKWIWAFIFICSAAVGAIGFALLLPWIRKNSGLWKLEQKLPFHRTLENLSEAFQRYANSPLQNVEVLTLSIFIHVFIFVASYTVALALGMTISFWQLAAVTSIINVLIAVPISISGLGARESLYVLFLAPLGVPAPQATALSLLVWGVPLIWALVGGLIFMRYKKHDATG